MALRLSTIRQLLRTVRFAHGAAGSSVDPQRRYEQLVDNRTLRSDEHQQRIIDKLQQLHSLLQGYDPPSLPEPKLPSKWASLFKSDPTLEIPSTEPPPHGLYLYGDVGTGKSMLMDLFYSTLPTHLSRRRRRVHFHAFMIDVHKRIHQKKAEGITKDPILFVARDLANEASILCFDEFQVTDIADAMILRRLLEYLLQFGVVCVMTSNRHPRELYKNGIQRESFVPCIDLLQEKFDVTDLNSGTDYRRIPRALSQVYYHPLNSETRSEMDKLFNAITSRSNILTNYRLPVWGKRVLTIPECTINTGSGSEGAGISQSSLNNDGTPNGNGNGDGDIPINVAKLSFKELCGDPLSAADYIELTRTFGIIMVTEIGKMGLSEKDLARRFITFIDSCYESRTKLFTSSEVPIFEIFSGASPTESQDKEVSQHLRSVMDDLGLPPELAGSSIFTGEEEMFAWARCCSRLVEMGGADWGVDRFS